VETKRLKLQKVTPVIGKMNNSTHAAALVGAYL
jgi:hypothetical protein